MMSPGASAEYRAARWAAIELVVPLPAHIRSLARARPPCTRVSVPWGARSHGGHSAPTCAKRAGQGPCVPGSPLPGRLHRAHGRLFGAAPRFACAQSGRDTCWPWHTARPWLADTDWHPASPASLFPLPPAHSAASCTPRPSGGTSSRPTRARCRDTPASVASSGCVPRRFGSNAGPFTLTLHTVPS